MPDTSYQAYLADIGGRVRSARASNAATRPAAVAASAGVKPKSKGGGSIFGNLVGDIENTVTGIVPGVIHLIEHPIAGVKGIGRQYGQYYGPLFHGDFGKFAHNVEQHPLQPILDAAAVATLGGSASAGVVSGLEKAGAVAEGGRAVRMLGKGTETTRRLGTTSPSGEFYQTGWASQNPATRLRNIGINKAVNQLPRGFKVIGPGARYARAANKAGGIASGLEAVTRTPITYLSRLSNPKIAAAHLLLQKITPEEFAALQEGGQVNAKIAKYYNNPTKTMNKYMQAAQSAAPFIEAHMKQFGNLTDKDALMRRYGPVAVARGLAGKDGKISVSNLKKLQKEFQGNEPIYLHHQGNPAEYVSQMGVGSKARIQNAPQKIGVHNEWTGALMRAGYLDLHANPYSTIPGIIRHTQRQVVRDEVLKGAENVHASEVPSRIKNGWIPIKTTLGEKSLPFMESKLLPQEDWLGSKDLPISERLSADGGKTYKMIPGHEAKLFQGSDRLNSPGIERLFYNKPTTIWKKLVLGLRPAYAVNIITSQHILAALQGPGKGRFITSYLNQLAPGARLGQLSPEGMRALLPEQTTTFSGSVITPRETLQSGRIVGSRASSGVMSTVDKVETFLRRVMAEGFLKAGLKDDKLWNILMKRHNGDINAAAKEFAAIARNPLAKNVYPEELIQGTRAKLNEIGRKIDHSQGNYRDYSPFEQRLRQIIPFYGWDRHILQSTYQILAHRPQYASIGTDIGRQGHEIQQQQFGELPPYLQGLVKLPGLPKFMGDYQGLTPSVLPRMLEPFNEDVNILRDLRAVASGQAGTNSEAFSSINPLLSGAYEQISGRNPITGGKVHDTLPWGVGNIPIRILGQVPQARLIEAATGNYPWGLGKPSPHPTYKADIQSQTAAFLGFPLKKLNKRRANIVASRIGLPPR